MRVAGVAERRQSSTNLMSRWAAVPGVPGQSSFAHDFESGPMYFCLTGP
jgi:hypothetical protein